MEPLSFCQASPTIGLQVASGPLQTTATSPSEGTAVTTIEPRPSLVVCTVHFAPAIHGNLMESLSGALRRDYPQASIPRVPSGRQVYFSAPDGNWAVWLTPCAIGLETRHFQEFGEFHERLGAVTRFLDPGLLYKRVGLRCIYQVPVEPRPLLPDQRHLSQVVQWRSHGGQSCFDLDVSAENVPPAQLGESLEEIFRASRPLAPGQFLSHAVDFWGGEPEAAVASLRTTPPTTVAAFPELLPFEPEPSEVETVADERAELLARKYGGEELSRDEQERLASLTVRLEKLLPPVSIQELENLLEMAEEAEHIRQWARESRQGLGLK